MNEGKKFASMNNLPAPTFLGKESLSNIERFDLLYVNTSLQYIYNLNSLLDNLLEGKPSFIILQKLLVSTKDTKIFQQHFTKNASTKCIFHSERDLLDYFLSKGYIPIVNPVNDREQKSIIVHLPYNYKESIGDRIAIDLILKNIS